MAIELIRDWRRPEAFFLKSSGIRKDDELKLAQLKQLGKASRDDVVRLARELHADFYVESKFEAGTFLIYQLRDRTTVAKVLTDVREHIELAGMASKEDRASALEFLTAAREVIMSTPQLYQNTQEFSDARREYNNASFQIRGDAEGIV